MGASENLQPSILLRVTIPVMNEGSITASDPLAPLNESNVLVEQLWDGIEGTNIEVSLRSKVKSLMSGFHGRKQAVLDTVAHNISSLRMIDPTHEMSELYDNLNEALDEVWDMVKSSGVSPHTLDTIKEEVRCAEAKCRFSIIFSMYALLEQRTTNGSTSKKLDANTKNILRSALQRECIEAIRTHKERMPLIARDVEYQGKKTLGKEYEHIMLSTMGVAEVAGTYEKEDQTVYIAPAYMDANEGVDAIAVNTAHLSQADQITLSIMLSDNKTSTHSLEFLSPEALQALTYIQIKSRFKLPDFYERLLESGTINATSMQVLQALNDRYKNEEAVPAPQLSITALDERVHITPHYIKSAIVPGLNLPTLTLSYAHREGDNITWDASQNMHAELGKFKTLHQPFIEDRDTLYKLFGNEFTAGTGQPGRDVVIIEVGELIKLVGGNIERGKKNNRVAPK